MQKDVRSARATAEALGKALSAHELTLAKSLCPHERRVHVCCDINDSRRVVASALGSHPSSKILGPLPRRITCVQGDDDNDGLNDEFDPFPLDPYEQVDTDSDGVGDNGDNCPSVGNADQLNSDTDSLGNECDPDDDNDGLTDAEELALGTNSILPDTDGDGWSDKEEADEDTDPLSAGSQPELSTGLPIWLLHEATK